MVHAFIGTKIWGIASIHDNDMESPLLSSQKPETNTSGGTFEIPAWCAHIIRWQEAALLA